jgi:hypothetical protein
MTRHKKRYRPRPIALDTMALAKHFASKPCATDRADVLGPLTLAHTALRQGVATERHWSILAGALEAGKAIEKSGIVRGLAEHFACAETALVTIYHRATSGGTWAAPALHYQELDAVAVLVDLYSYQVGQLGRGELLACLTAAANHVRAHGDYPILEAE